MDIIQGNPIPEKDPDIYVLSFPTLFPYGKADMFDAEHKIGHTINARRALKMLMKKGQIIDGKLRFLFQEDDKFMYWCLNKIERAEALHGATVYIKNQKDRIESVEDLKSLLTKGDKWEMKKLLSASLRHQAGTQYYWINVKNKLREVFT